MKLASKVRVVEADHSTKTFSREDYSCMMRSANLIGAVAFWRGLERLAEPEEKTRFHACGVLRAFAEPHFRECGGVAFSPQHAQAFEYCGFKPTRIAARKN